MTNGRRRSCRRWLVVAVCSCCLSVGWAAVIPAGVAWADCTGAGDFGAGSGCPPPGDTSGSGGGESWPPTGVDWPPSPDADSESGDGGGSGGGASTPIVMPEGERTPAPVHTAQTPKPIVPVGAAVTGPSPSAIVTPTSSTG